LAMTSEVTTKRDRRATVSVFQETKDTLDSIKHPGQTYDGIIQELLSSWKAKQEAEEPRQGF